MTTSNWWSISTKNYNLNNDLNNSLINYKEIGKQFLENYYRIYYKNCKVLFNIYTQNAKLTFQNIEYLGIDRIKNKYITMNLTRPKHKIFTYDIQPIDITKVYIVVTGSFANSIESQITSFGNYTKVFNFIESFLIENINNKWYIRNHIFRIV